MKSLTPKKVALAIGVSESSMKRWCDRGLLQTTRTAGGHRRLTKSSVVQFLRTHEHRLVEPSLIGLPEPTAAFDLSVSEAAERLFEHLSKASVQSARSLILEQYIGGRGLGELFDRVVAPAFHRIGSKWECGELDVYHERRGCEVCVSALRELSELLPGPIEGAPVAIGGSPENDAYSVPSIMVEMILKDKGWQTESLGPHIPLGSFTTAVSEFQPKLVWMSVSHIENEQKFLTEYGEFAARLPAETWTVVGGRALTEQTRAQMKFSAYCDSMRQLENFAEKLHHPDTSAEATTVNGASLPG